MSLDFGWSRSPRSTAQVHVDLRFHDLRHTATSRLAEKLPNLIELASVTGHQTLQMLKRYYEIPGCRVPR
jgi:integrase